MKRIAFISLMVLISCFVSANAQSITEMVSITKQHSIPNFIKFAARYGFDQGGANREIEDCTRDNGKGCEMSYYSEYGGSSSWFEMDTKSTATLGSWKSQLRNLHYEPQGMEQSVDPNGYQKTQSYVNPYNRKVVIWLTTYKSTNIVGKITVMYN